MKNNKMNFKLFCKQVFEKLDFIDDSYIFDEEELNELYIEFKDADSWFEDGYEFCDFWFRNFNFDKYGIELKKQVIA